MRTCVRSWTEMSVESNITVWGNRNIVTGHRTDIREELVLVLVNEELPKSRAKTWTSFITVFTLGCSVSAIASWS